MEKVMKKIASFLALCFILLSCEIQEDVQQASNECKSAMAAVLDEIKTLQEDSCLTKAQVLTLLETNLQKSKSNHACDVNNLSD
jgi:hypothetical protein